MPELDYESQKLKEKVAQAELQTIIGKALKSGPKTEDELLQAIPDVKYDQLISALKSMLFLKLITKDGYPVKYSLSKEILDGLSSKKKLSEIDKNILKVAILIESKSNDKGDLRQSMEKIADALKNDKEYLIYSLDIADIVLHDELFSTFISAELSCQSLNSLFRLIYFYGATSVEILKPDKFTVGIADLQQTAQIITDMTHGYATMIYQLRQENSQLSRLRKP